jgi:CHAD domain-containing protein
LEPLRDFAIRQILQRLEKLVNETQRASAEAHDEEAIHDLRVSMRRFSQGLILFPEFLPESGVRKVRKKIKSMMNLTSEVRNRDIALEFLSDDADEVLKSRLRAEREQWADEFRRAVALWTAEDLAGKWRKELKL